MENEEGERRDGTKMVSEVETNGGFDAQKQDYYWLIFFLSFFFCNYGGEGLNRVPRRFSLGKTLNS